MKIAYDAKRAAGNATGLGNYSRCLIGAIANTFPSDELLLMSPSLPKEEFKNIFHPYYNVRWIHPRSTNGISKIYWRSFKSSKTASALNADIFHGLSGELPLNIQSSGIASVVTIHDLIFRRFPSYYKYVDRQIYDFKFRAACNTATRIIAISECTKRDIINLYGIAPEKISVVYQSCSPIFRAAVSEAKRREVREKYALPSEYLLQVGTIESRKNAALSVEGLALSGVDMPLIIAGRSTPYTKRVIEAAEKHGIKERIRIIDGVPNDDLPALYTMASISLYPSRYEGFGLPVTESLNCSTPVIAATGSCLEEAGGEGAFYVDPDDPSDMAHAISLIASDNNIKDRLGEIGKRHVAKFSEENMASETYAVYSMALESKLH